MIAPIDKQRESEPDWEELDRKYRRLLSWLATRRGFGPEDVDDIVQNTWLRLWKSHRKWGEHSVMACLKHSLGLEMLEELRWRRGRTSPKPTIVTNADWDMLDRPIPRSEKHEELREAISRLPDKWREPLLMQMAGHIQAEIADVLGYSVASVEGRLRQARRELAWMLSVSL